MESLLLLAIVFLLLTSILEARKRTLVTCSTTDQKWIPSVLALANQGLLLCDVQEFAQERYEKVLAPKIAEESAQATREEVTAKQHPADLCHAPFPNPTNNFWCAQVTAKRRQADLLNAAAATAAEQQCMRLLSLVDVSDEP
eukprot:1159087-Pelagomonas_calceolata.AAC.3